MIKQKAYVIGTNASSSLSPAIFLYWFEKYKIDYAEYGYKEIDEKNFDKEIKLILKEENLIGLNITIPYKEKIYFYIDNKKSLIPSIDGIPQVKNPPINCITLRKAHEAGYVYRIHGKNTDGVGFHNALNGAVTSNWDLKDKKCAIVLGYGGAAKAIIDELKTDSSFARIMVFNRTFDKIKKLKEKEKGLFVYEIEPYEIEDLPKHINKAHLIINTTPINILSGQTKWKINPECYGFDIVYKPWDGTGFLRNFEEKKRIEGIHMLVHQAAPCFKDWFGIDPKIDTSLFQHLYKKMGKNK